MGRKKEYCEGITKMVSPCCKWIFYLAIVTLTSFTQALEVAVLNDISEMIQSKKIVLRVDFSSEEKFLYRDMLRFSSSNPRVILRYWKASVAAKSEYISSFHQTKRVFTEPFDLEITFEGADTKETSLSTELTSTNIIISYVSLNDQLMHEAKTTVIPIARSELSSPAPGHFALNNNSAATPETKSLSLLVNTIYDEEISYLHQVEDFYYQLGNLINRITQSTGFIFIIALFTLITFFGIWNGLRKKYSFLEKHYPPQLTNLIISLSPITLAYCIKTLGAVGESYVILGIYILIIGCYLLIKQDQLAKNSKTKSLAIIGSLFCISSLPIIIKGLLLMLE